MKNPRIGDLVAKIKALESELEEELHQEYEKFTCEITKKRSELLLSYRHDRENIFSYLIRSPLLHIVSVPIIWVVLFPAVILDGFVSIYQWICFPIYKIDKVRRSDYIVIDRHRLHYLNLIEKLNCLYCSYFNGLMGYISEIAARTEQYWCPIRHAKRLKSMHGNYKHFFDYGDSENFRKGLVELRAKLKEEKE
ncbi:MAG: hypothetical protein NTY39_04865 [Campylobacterales bacterium]|nr:hypothetical protein [Campylobacterales bacterium]